MTDLAEALIAEQEGLRLTAYRDTRGLWTIGYGHLLRQDLDWTGHAISQSQAEAYLEADMQSARDIADRFPHFLELGPVRQAVLVSMAYQLGAAPLRWPKFMDALRDEDYDRAAEEGLDTLWHQQTPKRCELEMQMLRTDLWSTQ